jgi:hypothetical protein
MDSRVTFSRKAGSPDCPVGVCHIRGNNCSRPTRRRLWELLKSQGMQENQQVVFLSDGGERVRNL